MTTDITELAQRVERIISDMKLKHGVKDTYAPVMKWDEFLALVEALELKEEQRANWFQMAQKLGEDLEAAEKRNAELEEAEQKLCAANVTLDARAELAERRLAEMESRTVTAAATDVLAERQRQVTAERWTAERDDGYQNSELADAAACYAIHAHNQGFSTPAHWPWSPDWWKQTSPRRDLVKAGALILAEIERLDRAAGIKWEAE
ncbi:hypothetical protein [Klebsiella michiganensis]|uniref:hypothetical protein n=1 Tax=Klebsiella michiganensis TaxID=1134687 RepID=UPI001EDE386C|nr:hypothetical protein [Klebsiella michiganensis]MDQ2142991.1 hypothetical protein [Klebsiella michiganensis]MDV6970560.1 hypothetical protein [Klebsiella michiganensis]MDW5480047.1 hypothetical protein [Klebsiella michiganensis]MDW5493781.1 hypothetical protein [Klebsiella michiganensis]MDZ5705761.1 hypothetical protein [Klebsiella michiganensis]